MNPATGSRQISWWEVHEYVTAKLQQIGVEQWPLIGTAQWRQLDDSDPAKLAAALDASQHLALRLDAAQSALAEASRDIAAAEDCGRSRPIPWCKSPARSRLTYPQLHSSNSG